jgi:hypothetical protein
MQPLTLLWFELDAAKRQLNEALAESREPGKESLAQPEQRTGTDQERCQRTEQFASRLACS